MNTNSNTFATVTRNAVAAAQETFRRVYPLTPSPEQMQLALKAMADAITPVMKKFALDARIAPHNTEAHYAAAVLAIATAGVRAIAFARTGQEKPVATPTGGRKLVA